MNVRTTLAPLALAAASTFGIAGAVSATSAPVLVQEETAKHPKLDHLNLSKKGLAIEGYDPVAYFPEFGGKATKGKKDLQAVHRGVTYYFASEKNRAAFLESPARFEPAYGGWCAWALYDGKGDKVDPSPKSFTVEDGKLYLFYDGFFGDTRKKWNKAGAAPELAAKADTNWERITAPKKK